MSWVERVGWVRFMFWLLNFTRFPSAISQASLDNYLLHRTFPPFHSIIITKNQISLHCPGAGSSRIMFIWWLKDTWIWKFSRKILISWSGVSLTINNIKAISFSECSQLADINIKINIPTNLNSVRSSCQIVLLRIMKSFEITGQFFKSRFVLNSVRIILVFLQSATIDWVFLCGPFMIGWEDKWNLSGDGVCDAGLEVFQGRLGQIWEFSHSRGQDRDWLTASYNYQSLHAVSSLQTWRTSSHYTNSPAYSARATTLSRDTQFLSLCLLFTKLR